MTVTELHPKDEGPDYGRTPPHDLHAEQSVLGACLISEAAFDEVVDTGLRGADFYRPAHESVWDAVRALRQRREPVDGITVANELLARGDLARIGGPAYLHSLQESTPTAANVVFYARIVRERAVLRRLVMAGTRVVQLGYAADGGNVDEIVNASVAEVSAVADTVHVAKDETLDDIADRALAMIEEGDPAVPSPWADLNHVIGGTRPGRFIAIGARPGCGKTIMGLQWAISNARHLRARGMQVAYFTFEMTAERLYQRALSSASGVSTKAMQGGRLTDSEWKKVIDADIDLRTLPLRLVGASGWSPQQVRAKARQMHRARPIGLVAVDHIGLTRPERSGGKESRQAELSEAADVFLGVAHELSCSVMVMTQLNRGLASRADQRPVPTDVRDTDRIEQNSDLLLLLHRDKDSHPEEMWVAVAKNREGDEQAVKLSFDGPRSRIAEHGWNPSR